MILTINTCYVKRTTACRKSKEKIRELDWSDDEILQVMRDLGNHDVEMLTLGQYLQPTRGHLPVLRYVEPARFKQFEQEALAMGFRHAACGPLVRSSYHADQQAHEAGVV